MLTKKKKNGGLVKSVNDKTELLLYQKYSLSN